MRAKGNGNPAVCVSNLLQLVRGECVYERCKGIDATLYDQPVEIVRPLVISDAKWVIQTYEPRVDVNAIDLEALIPKIGNFGLTADMIVEG